MATVAVVIPAYNGEAFIRRSMDSVLAQTVLPDEIFVVDDGSTDRTVEILETEYAGKIILLRQSRGGPARARNAATAEAKSELVAYLDAEDWWEPAKLERQVEALAARPDAVLCYTSLRVVQEADGAVSFVTRVPGEDARKKLRWCNPQMPPACVLVRKAAVEQVGGFDERYKGNEDWNLWLKLAAVGPFVALAEPLTDYRASEGGLSGNADHMYNDFLPMLEQLLGELKGVPRALWRRRIVAHQAFVAAMTARGANDKATEWKYMARSLKAWPSPFWSARRTKAFTVALLRGRRK